MSDLSLTKTQLRSGVWQGVLEGSETEPLISVTHLEQEIGGAKLTEGKEPNTWVLQVPIPSEAISDGVQTLLITDKANQRLLDKITLIAGEALGDDLRAEVDLLRVVIGQKRGEYAQDGIGGNGFQILKHYLKSLL